MEMYLLLALMVGLIAFRGTITRVLSRNLNQKVLFRGSHEQGQKAAHTAIRFTAPNATAKDVLASIRRRLALGRDVPALKGSSYVEAETATQIAIGFGNKLNRSARLVISVEDGAPGSGCVGTFVVTNWTESDGLVAGYQEIVRLGGQVQQGVRDADPSATFTEQRT